MRPVRAARAQRASHRGGAVASTEIVGDLAAFQAFIAAG
jgi:hypothetical protein